jgi:hypothetical protein
MFQIRIPAFIETSMNRPASYELFSGVPATRRSEFDPTNPFDRGIFEVHAARNRRAMIESGHTPA